MKKRLTIFILFFLLLIVSMYSYLIVNKPLSLGIGYDPNTNEIIIDFDNESIFPIYIDSVLVTNEKDTHINGKEYMYRLNAKHININSEQLQSPDLKDEVELFEPFQTLYVQANDDHISNSIIIKDGSFNEINEVTARVRILGFVPFQVSRNVELKINEVGDNPDMSWGLKILFAKNPSLVDLSGKGVKIALIDSGVYAHEALTNIESISMIDQKPTEDELGHGTQMAGTIIGKGSLFRGVAPEARLFSVKIINQENSNVVSLEKAIDWSIENDIDIINLSLTGEEEVNKAKDIIQAATNKGIHVVAAVGDWDSKSIGNPAAFNNVIAVAAIDMEGKLHAMSNFDNNKDILLSPGVAMLTTGYGNTYNYISGSSVATSFATGVIALLLEKHGTLSHEQLLQILNPLFSDTFQTL